MIDMGQQRKIRTGSTCALVVASAAAILLSSLVGTTHAQEMSTDERIKKLEERIERMQDLIKQSQEVDVKSVEERVERLEQQRPAPGGPPLRPGNMIVFRGGAAFLASDRANEVFTDVFGTFGTGARNDDTTGWYFGGALDLLLSRDAWGMMKKTSVLGEIGVEYKEWNSKTVAQAVTSTATTAFTNPGPPPGGTVFSSEVQLTMLTVSISPKIKFMEGSRFRPWIIPAGLDFHVISPPSDDSTVLDIGVQWAAGAEYRIWKELHLGVDGRFHLAAGNTGTTNNFGTVGAYLGIGF